MPQPCKDQAVILLPRDALAEMARSSSAGWLAKGDISQGTDVDRLARVARHLGFSAEGVGRAALRYWGDTSTSPVGWITAADPVFLAAHLDHLRLHAMPETETSKDLAELVEELNNALGGDQKTGRFFEAAGHGYLQASDALFVSASRHPEQISGEEPSPFMPEGADYQRLQSEIQMVLHGSSVNARRESAGQRAINALWLWGGGFATDVETRELPAFFGNDPVLAGYWHSSGAEVAEFPGRLTDCLESQGGCIAVLPGNGSLLPYVEEARQLLASGDLRELLLMFDGGPEICLRRSQRFRFWRGNTLKNADGVASP